MRLTRNVLLVIGCLMLVSACDRIDTSIRIGSDGSGEWTQTVTITRDGFWAEDWDILSDAADRNENDPENFLSEALWEILPESGDSLLQNDGFLGMPTDDVDLDLTRTDAEIRLSASRREARFEDMMGTAAVPGQFDMNSEGQARYQVNHLIATVFTATGLGMAESGGETSLVLEVPGVIVDHNAHEVDANRLTWKWTIDTDEDVPADAELGRVIAVWDPDAANSESGGGLGRIGLLAVAVLALGIGTAVLMTFRPPGFDDDPDDEYESL